MADYTLLHGDCLTEMAAMDAGSVDAVCTDSPYGISFMGRGWDHTVPGVEFWTEALRLLKPSCYLVSMGGTRTWHRLACAIEDAGFEIRDTLMWLHGQGFPKGKSCLKPAWEPIILARKPGPMRELGIEECRIPMSGESPTALRRSYGYTPNLEKAAESEARGALCDRTDPAKRAAPHPSDNLGRWPANLVLECTCDETREGTAKTGTAVKRNLPDSGASQSINLKAKTQRGDDVTYSGPDGKEPVRIHTDPNCPCAMLDGQTGTKKSGSRVAGVRTGLGYHGADGDGGPAIAGDSGGASRFFYCAKASRSERDSGLHQVSERDECGSLSGRIDGTLGKNTARRSNHHPTVKPLALMRWLVKLVAQPGDVVLDPFMGSGTTGVACVMEGREFIGIDSEAEYMEIARRRIDHASAQGVLPLDESPPLPPVAGRPT